MAQGASWCCASRTVPQIETLKSRGLEETLEQASEAVLHSWSMQVTQSK